MKFDILQWLDRHFSANEEKTIERLEEELKEERTRNGKLNEELEHLEGLINIADDDISELLEEIEELDTRRSVEKETEALGYKRTKNISYKNKRFIKGKGIAIKLNELVTPNSYEVEKFRKGIKIPKGSNNLTIARKVGDKVARHLTWHSDMEIMGKKDFYNYPEESIILRDCDCEDHSFLIASLYPEVFGVAYGFLTVGNNRFGHAFNYFIENDILYVLETTGNVARIESYHKGSDYEIHYLITEHNTYKVKGGASFGRIAW